MKTKIHRGWEYWAVRLKWTEGRWEWFGRATDGHRRILGFHCPTKSEAEACIRTEIDKLIDRTDGEVER